MDLYAQVLELTVPYFATRADAERFLARQCKHHLKLDPQHLAPEDLWHLARWVEISSGLLFGSQKAGELKAGILALGTTGGPGPTPRGRSVHP